MDGWEILTFGTISIDVPTSNPLPSTYRNHPEYSGPLSRIAACVAAYDPKSVILDIGANVGDTAAIIRSVASDAEIYCFEGDQFVLTPSVRTNKQ